MMSDLQRKRAETTDSLSLAQKARTLFERLVSEHPLDVDLRIDLARSHTNLGRQFEQSGDSEEALRSFQRAIDLYESLPDFGPQTAFDLACNISRCIPLIGTKNRSTDSSRTAPGLSKSDQLRRQFYGDRAIAALRRAAGTGLFTTETLENEKDLDSLHERADFRKLIKDLEKESAAPAN
jgi:tetratricopeptide (TPR) repeat protein